MKQEEKYLVGRISNFKMAIDIDRIMKQSQRAICGAFEREIVVEKNQVEVVKKLLKSKGQMIVGTGGVGLSKTKKKIWYNPQGMVGL